MLNDFSTTHQNCWSELRQMFHYPAEAGIPCILEVQSDCTNVAAPLNDFRDPR